MGGILCDNDIKTIKYQVSLSLSICRSTWSYGPFLTNYCCAREVTFHGVGSKWQSIGGCVRTLDKINHDSQLHRQPYKSNNMEGRPSCD